MPSAARSPGVGAMVPEGLVLLTSIAFAVGAMRLARRRVLVQELAAIEGLARVDTLCIDKTGTLTRPGMHLEQAELLSGRAEGEVGDVIGAVAAADPAPNATMQALAERYRAPAGWVVTVSGAVLLGSQVERGDLRRARQLGAGRSRRHRQLPASRHRRSRRAP